MTPRQESEAICLKYIDMMLPGSANTQRYKDRFAKMSDNEFAQFIDRLATKKERLSIVASNLSDQKLSIERNFEIADEMGYKFHERLWMDESNDIPPYLSGPSYLVMLMPIRRQAQHLVKKISIPKHNRSIDELSGQVTGASKGSKMSFPETQILAAKQLDHCILEAIKYRGGDLKGFNAMNTMIARNGAVSQEAIEPYSGNVRSTETLAVLLTMMHIDNTLLVKRKRQ